MKALEMTSDKLIELEVIDLANEGKAVAQFEGKVVFLKGGLPGERVLAEITKNKSRYCEATVRRIITRSKVRIPPRCRHFDTCGGCTWQDLEYPGQLVFKRKHVVDSIERIGGLDKVEVLPIVPSNEVFFYRNKMEFSFHVDESGDFKLGLHHRGKYDEIFNVEQCLLQSPTSNNLVAWFRRYVAENKITVYHVKKHGGYMRFLMIREGKNTAQTMVNIVTNYGEFPEAAKLVGALTGEFPEITTIVHNQNGGKANVASGEIEKVLHGPGYIEERIGGMVFRIRANSFFQTNPRQAEILYKTAFELLKLDPGDRLMDLYCGTGTIGLLASRKVAEVTGVELVGEAIHAARENAALNNINNIIFYQEDVKDFLLKTESDGKGFNIIIVDPPRAGLHPKAIQRLTSLRPEKILYISCNPATFARDAAELVKAGYNLPKVVPVDMFPHTTHVELTGVFYNG